MAPLTWSGAWGPPQYAITRGQLEFLISCGFRPSQMAGILNVSLKTVKRRLRWVSVVLKLWTCGIFVPTNFLALSLCSFIPGWNVVEGLFVGWHFCLHLKAAPFLGKKGMVHMEDIFIHNLNWKKYQITILFNNATRTNEVIIEFKKAKWKCKK